MGGSLGVTSLLQASHGLFVRIDMCVLGYGVRGALRWHLAGGENGRDQSRNDFAFNSLEKKFNQKHHAPLNIPAL